MINKATIATKEHPSGVTRLGLGELYFSDYHIWACIIDYYYYK